MEQARNKVTDFDTNRNTKYQRLYGKYLIQDTIQSVPTAGKVKSVQSPSPVSALWLASYFAQQPKMFKNLYNSFNAWNETQAGKMDEYICNKKICMT